MKKLIAALVLATSFAAFADDAAKTDAPKTTKKQQEGEEVLDLAFEVHPGSGRGDSAK